MKLYVEEQDMPQNCAECKAEGHYENSYGDECGFFCPFGYKAYTSGTRDTKRLDNCPLVPVQPHGRLIDASKIGLTDFEIILCQNGNPFKNALEMLLEKIENAPTIIPAEEGE